MKLTPFQLDHIRREAESRFNGDWRASADLAQRLQAALDGETHGRALRAIALLAANLIATTGPAARAVHKEALRHLVDTQAEAIAAGRADVSLPPAADANAVRPH